MLAVNIFSNGDHVCLAWRPADPDPKTWAPIADCRGFAIRRKLTRGNQPSIESWLRNRIGFQQGETPPPPAEAWRWPIQRYMWWDYDVEPGDSVSYCVVPVLGGPGGLVQPDLTGATWTQPFTIGPAVGDGVSAWFNRGVIATQWVARALQAKGGAPKTTLLQAVSTPGDPLREQLAGHLKPALLDLLKNAPGPVYAALYELNDAEVIAGLKALGSRCHLILGNGAFGKGKTDENADVRQDLRTTSQIDLHDRIVSQGHFAHNKFILFCDAAGMPEKVWTGSTNLTVTGLCTQVNNGILIEDPGVAADFRAAWDRLEQAGNAYGAPLVAGNSTATTHGAGATAITPWFAATGEAQDMDFARARIKAAKDGILFLFFFPGTYTTEPARETLLQTILEEKASSDVYTRGVVNQEIKGLTDAAATAPVNLIRSGDADPSHLPKSVLVPEAIKSVYYDWESELKGASSVMVHSKVVVIDPFGAKPVVMTGSHNMGYKASHANDDNLVVLEGNAALAQAYAANIVSIFQEYRWRDYVGSHTSNGWHGLEDNDQWQAGHLQREVADMLFWVP